MVGDCVKSMRELPEKSVNCCVTSPPYFGLRDYGMEEQVGLEQTPAEYVKKMVEVFREVRRVLADDGTFWLNIGDSYGKGKQLLGVPWRLALALQDDGWLLRQDIIWNKTNAMPESVRDRCTAAHEYIFLLTKKKSYFYDHVAIKEPAVGGTKGAASFKREKSKRGQEGICPASPMATHRQGREDIRYDGPLRNKRSVWNVATKPFAQAHFATFPAELIQPCVMAGCPQDGTVLDPFGGSGTVAGVAIANGRHAILCELNPEYAELVPARVTAIVEAAKKAAKAS